MKIDRIESLHYCIPFRTPFENASNRFHQRNGIFIRIYSDEFCGVGEAAPLKGFSHDSLSDVENSLHMFTQKASSGDMSNTDISMIIRQCTENSPAARFALETASLDIQATRIDLPIAKFLNSFASDSIPSNSLISAADLRSATPPPAGIETIKCKLGQRPFADDLSTILSYLEKMDRPVKLRLDINGAWNLAEAVSNCNSLEDLPIDYIEQPLPAEAILDLAELRKRTQLLIAVDESLTDISSARLILEEEAADIFIIKPSVSGGFEDSYHIIQLARAAGVLPIITSSLESNVGRMALIHMACANNILHPCGLLTGHLLKETDELQSCYDDGIYYLPDEPGLGLKKGICEIHQKS